jgi:hypothetical protein
MKVNIIAFISGLLIALGLGFAQLTRPEIILGFLNFSDNWNPAAFLYAYGVALLTYMILYHLFYMRQLTNPFRDFLDGKEKLTWSLVLGAAIFGIGWGMTGMCPGPAIISVITFKPFVIAFLIGMISTMELLKVFKNDLPPACYRNEKLSSPSDKSDQKSQKK